MTERDQYAQSQVQALLQPGEQIRNMAFVVKAPSILVQILLMMVCGWILIFFMTKHYYAVLTDRRVIFVQTGMGFFHPKMENRGIHEISLADVKNVTQSGFANNRSFALHLTSGTTDEYRIPPWSKAMSGQSRWLDEVTQIRQLTS